MAGIVVVVVVVGVWWTEDRIFAERRVFTTWHGNRVERGGWGDGPWVNECTWTAGM